MEAFRLSAKHPGAMAMLGMVYARAGLVEEVQQVLNDIQALPVRAIRFGRRNCFPARRSRSEARSLCVVRKGLSGSGGAA